MRSCPHLHPFPFLPFPCLYQRDGLEAPVLNAGHPVTRALVLEALRHWAAEYRLEGFVFLNAENLTQVWHGGMPGGLASGDVRAARSVHNSGSDSAALQVALARLPCLPCPHVRRLLALGLAAT